jgi:spore coat protein JC
MGRVSLALGNVERGKKIMWIYEKKLQYPVNVSGKNIQLAKWVITQYGGPDFRFYYQ